MVEVFAIGFPKSGTTTLHHALNEAGLPCAHQKIPSGFCGRLMYEALEEGDNPFRDFTAYRAVTQGDVCRPQRGLNFWPQLDPEMLDAVEQHNPDLKLVLQRRHIPDLIRSIRAWSNMHERIVACDIPGLPAGVGETDEELADWIAGHYAMCRERYAGHPNFLEFDIADPDAPSMLSAFLGVSLPWWGVKLPVPRNPRPGRARRSAGRAVRDARKRAGLTQEELAERVDVLPQYIRALEEADVNPSVGQLWAIAEALEGHLHVELRPGPPPEDPEAAAPQRNRAAIS